jgi:hypothetical protein
MYDDWLREFQERAGHRERIRDEWPAGGALPVALVRSLQRFQVGEDGDGAALIAKSAAAGDPAYLAAVRLFVAEEQSHARLLAMLLESAGARTVGGHWSDAAFVAIRRAAGLRWELMTLMLAEVVALRYYAALRDGAADPLVRAVTRKILADEERHVPFHVRRLRDGFAGSPALVRIGAAGTWWALMMGAAAVVAAGHGAALWHAGLGRRRFVTDIARLFRPIVRSVFRRSPSPGELRRTGTTTRAVPSPSSSTPSTASPCR